MPKTQLKISWALFREAALDRLAEKYPAIAVNRGGAGEKYLG